MAPSWMTISKAAARGPTNPSAWPARIRWPVDETGRNSVAPSTSPRTIAARRVGTASSYTKRSPLFTPAAISGGSTFDDDLPLELAFPGQEHATHPAAAELLL